MPATIRTKMADKNISFRSSHKNTGTRAIRRKLSRFGMLTTSPLRKLDFLAVGIA
jgi:hypothetical protein